MDYGKLLSRAWNIIWEHKFLWAFWLRWQAAGAVDRAGAGWRTTDDDGVVRRGCPQMLVSAAGQEDGIEWGIR
jgi:hypothetical protein